MQELHSRRLFLRLRDFVRRSKVGVQKIRMLNMALLTTKEIVRE
jgi:hypothetical protein